MKSSLSTAFSLTVLVSLGSVVSSSSPLPSSSSAFAPSAPLHASVALTAPGNANTNPAIDTNGEGADTSSSTKSSPDYKLLWSRIDDITTVAFDHGVPLLGNTHSDNLDYWQLPTRRFNEDNVRVDCTNADRFIGALQLLCPTYVQYSRALAGNGKLAPNVVPAAIRQTLARQYEQSADGNSFDLDTAKSILQTELSSSSSGLTEVQAAILIDTLAPLPHASSSIQGQVYMGYLPDFGPVTVKIQNPNAKKSFEKDAKLMQNMAHFVQTFCEMLPENNAATQMQQKVNDLTQTMERDIDYKRQVESAGGEILKQFCTEHVIVSRQMQIDDLSEDGAEDIAESVTGSIAKAAETAAESSAEIAAEHSVKSSKALSNVPELELVTQGGGGFRKLVARLWRMDVRKVCLTFFAILLRVVSLGQLDLYMDEA